jgi:two-component system, NtrC family, response regulator AtoC
VRILVVDDDPCTLNAIKIGLMSRGYEVFTGKAGEDALRVIQLAQENNRPPDLLLTDLRMPEMNGLELIKSAREFMPEIRAVLMTAYGDDDVRIQAGELGKCGYIDKPFSPGMLIGMIEEESVAA